MATVNKAFRVKNGLTVEGAELRPAAGTTTYPPILLTSGTNLTSATAGAFEYDGTRFYLSPSTTRKAIALTDSTGVTLDSTITGSSLTSVGTLSASGSLSLAGVSIDGSAGSVANSVTFNNGGSGDASGTTFNGSAARTVSYNTVGAAASSHAHGNITSAGAIGSTADLIVKTTTSGVLTTLAAGTSGQVLKHDATFGAMYIGTTAIQASSANQALTGITSITGNSGVTLTISNSNAISLESAASVGAPSGSVTIKTGNVTTSGNSGSVTIDTGTAAGTAGTIFIGGSNASSVEVGRSGQTTVIKGNLQIDGTTTTVNSTTVTVDDKNIVLGNDNTLDTQADGGGITLNGTTAKTFNWVDATDSWTSNQHVNIASSLSTPAYKIAGTNVLTADTLGANVLNSSLTSVGTITTGTWSATTIATNKGGTGLTSFTSGGAVYATSTSALTTGTLPVSAGGTGITAFGTGVATALGVNVGSAGAFVTNGGALGTPSSATLTNATGLPVSTGISGLGTGVATALAVNVGSAGAFVTFNGALGTPSSGTLTNATGLPISTGVSGLGTGVATFLATPTSANLRSALSDESGTGALVFAGGDIGAATATTAAVDTNTTQVATTAYVIGQGYVKAASPALTGTPTINSVAGLVTASGSTTGTTALTLSSMYDRTVYDGGEFIIKATNSTNIEIMKVLVITNGTDVYITTYGETFVTADLVTVDFSYTSNNVNMVVTPVAGTTGTTTVKVTGTLVAV